MNVKQRILVIEDDPHIADLLELHLRDERYHAMLCSDGRDGLRRLESENWDVLVLDLTLPNLDGLDICRRARTLPRYLPIIITSARTSEVQRIVGLEMGADDYMVKPYSIIELIARIKALLRRSEAVSKEAQIELGRSSCIRIGGLEIDPISREAHINSQLLDLTPREFDLLIFFARHPGKLFSRTDLLNGVWGYSHDGYEHTVNTHINRLRAKIEDNPAEPTTILTVWGKGYKFAKAAK